MPRAEHVSCAKLGNTGQEQKTAAKLVGWVKTHQPGRHRVHAMQALLMSTMALVSTAQLANTDLVTSSPTGPAVVLPTCSRHVQHSKVLRRGNGVVARVEQWTATPMADILQTAAHTPRGVSIGGL